MVHDEGSPPELRLQAHLLLDSLEEGTNPYDVLHHMGRLERPVATEAADACTVYTDFWRLASEVYDCGEAEHASKTSDSGGAAKYVASSWLDSLTAGGKPSPSGAPPTVVTRLLATPNFCTFNASLYKTFAVSLSASLSRLTSGKMRMEVFHPEYVGGKMKGGQGRRTPWPSLMICYERE